MRSFQQKESPQSRAPGSKKYAVSAGGDPVLVCIAISVGQLVSFLALIPGARRFED